MTTEVLARESVMTQTRARTVSRDPFFAVMHRRLGVAGAVLAVAVPFAGLLATSQVVGRVVASGISLDADASVLGIGVGGPVV